jgi:hypothetical protein
MTAGIDSITRLPVKNIEQLLSASGKNQNYTVSKI